MMKPIIEIKNLSAGYDGRTVLHDVNLSIYEQDFLGIIGPNGGGKTTLIKCILGLLKPTGGEIIFHTPEKAPIRTSTEGTSTETSAKNSHQSSSAKSQLLTGLRHLFGGEHPGKDALFIIRNHGVFCRRPDRRSIIKWANRRRTRLIELG